MKHGSPGPFRDILGEVHSQFTCWRQSRKQGTRIPEALWRAAVDAARAHSVSKASHVLGLDYYALKKRLESTAAPLSESVPATGGGFVEIPLFAAPECVFEIEDARGARLRVELKGSASVHCETLAQALWSLVR
jgi:hypothetical protein